MSTGETKSNQLLSKPALFLVCLKHSTFQAYFFRISLTVGASKQPHSHRGYKLVLIFHGNLGVRTEYQNFYFPLVNYYRNIQKWRGKEFNPFFLCFNFVLSPLAMLHCFNKRAYRSTTTRTRTPTDIFTIYCDHAHFFRAK